MLLAYTQFEVRTIYRTKTSSTGTRGRQITTLSGKLLDLYESIRDHQDARGRTLSSPFMKVPSKSVSCYCVHNLGLFNHMETEKWWFSKKNVLKSRAQLFKINKYH